MTITAWRIVKPYLVEQAFSGEGARLYGGRWNSRGVPVVYTAGSLSLAAMEMLVHLESYEILDSYICIPVKLETDLIQSLSFQDLPDDWTDTPAPYSTQAIGDAWLRDQTSLVLEVPSVIIPSESNFLINVRHPDVNKIETGIPQPFVFDYRLLR